MQFANRSVQPHDFAMVPRVDVPRSAFLMDKSDKFTFNGGQLVPIFCEEVLPGDSWNVDVTLFGRLATPLRPFLDNLHLDTQAFFVPTRLLWDNWTRFMGETDSATDPAPEYLTPQIEGPEAGWSIGSLADFFGLPCQGQYDASLSTIVFPFRAYTLIWNEWYRDQNQQGKINIPMGDGPDSYDDYGLLPRGKRYDYFTSCLPWPLKGGVEVPLPITGNAPVYTSPTVLVTGVQSPITAVREDGTATGGPFGLGVNGGTVGVETAGSALSQGVYFNNLFAQLDGSILATINDLREAAAVQRLLELDARGGTRYTELLRSHFGVMNPDARLQRPEYLGSSTTRINVNPVAQTSSSVEGQPKGDLGAQAAVISRSDFNGAFTEHGYVMVLASIRADLTYQQGIRKMHLRRTKHDYYWPTLAHLGEQAVLRKEIYAQGNAIDEEVFGYNEAWSEYRYLPSQVHNEFLSYAPQTLDVWHLAQYFDAPPTLGEQFIRDNPPISRVLAVPGEGGIGRDIILDTFFRCRVARPLPLHSVPGFTARF